MPTIRNDHHHSSDSQCRCHSMVVPRKKNKVIHSTRNFPDKPSIYGYPHLWNPAKKWENRPKNPALPCPKSGPRLVNLMDPEDLRQWLERTRPVPSVPNRIAMLSKVSMSSYGGFLSHGDTSKSSIYRWIFHEINHPFGGSPFMETTICPY